MAAPIPHEPPPPRALGGFLALLFGPRFNGSRPRLSRSQLALERLYVGFECVNMAFEGVQEWPRPHGVRSEFAQAVRSGFARAGKSGVSRDRGAIDATREPEFPAHGVSCANGEAQKHETRLEGGPVSRQSRGDIEVWQPDPP